MLQRIKPKIGEPSRILVVEDAKHSAFFSQLVHSRRIPILDVFGGEYQTEVAGVLDRSNRPGRIEVN
jgi:hypothetical protein